MLLERTNSNWTRLIYEVGEKETEGKTSIASFI